MSVLTDLLYGGSNAVAGLTEGAVNDAIAKYGAEKEIAFPDTAYFFPTIYAATGVKVKTLGDLPACVGVLKSLITNQEDLGQALNAGLATAVGAEILEVLKYAEGGDPYAEDSGIGFVPDPIIRSLGVPLVTGDIPGVAVVLGKAENAADVAAVVKDYQSKGIMTFLVGDVIEQCAEGGVKMGLEFRIVPLGHDVTSVIHVVTVAVRAALIFGNVQPGDLGGLLEYTKNRVPAFVNTFGAIDAVVVSAGAGAIALGFPVVVDIDLGENQVPGALESVCDHNETVKTSLELRDIKIKVTKRKLCDYLSYLCLSFLNGSTVGLLKRGNKLLALFGIGSEDHFVTNYPSADVTLGICRVDAEVRAEAVLLGSAASKGNNRSVLTSCRIEGVGRL